MAAPRVSCPASLAARTACNRGGPHVRSYSRHEPCPGDLDPGVGRRTRRHRECRRTPGQVDRDGLHVRRQQPRGLHRQGPRARARRARLDAQRPGHGPGRPRSGLRQEPRRLADDQALPPDPGDARRRRAPGRRLGRAEHGQRPDAQGLRHLVQGELPGRSLRPLLLGPRLGLAPRLDDGGQLIGRGRWPEPRRGQVGPAPARVHRRRRLRRLQHGPDRDHGAVGRQGHGPHGLPGVREHGRHRVRRPPLAAQRQPEHDGRPGRRGDEREHDLRGDLVRDGRRQSHTTRSAMP